MKRRLGVWGRLRRVLWLGLAMGCWVGPVHAQSLIDLYREARFNEQVRRIESENGFRAVPMPPEPIPLLRRDAVLDRILPAEAPPDPATLPFRMRRIHMIPKLNRQWFLNRHEGKVWTYSGNEDTFTRLDTTFTRELRALLQARYGAPTQTVAEKDYRSIFKDGDSVQFEYWFEVNDTVPLIVLDVNGPFERGLVLATDAAHAGRLLELREAFLGDLLEAEGPERYVDYYYHAEESAWYLTGYDGAAYFTRPIRRPNLKRGRPWLPFLRN